MEIFTQEFEPASYFCDLTCVHLITRQQKWGPISENEVIRKMKLSKNGLIISCSPDLIILTETKIKIIKLIFDVEN